MGIGPAKLSQPTKKESTMKRTRLATLLLAGVLTTLAPQWAMADGTLSGTTIANKATVNYQVGGVTQTLIESSLAGNSNPGAGNGSDTTFVVDDKVNFTVASNDAGFVTTYPGSSAVALKFTVTNTGNTVHDFALSHIVGGANTFTEDSIAYYADTNGNGTYEPATDTTVITYIDELGVDSSKVVFLVATVPSAATNNQVASYALKAEAHAGGGAASLGAITTANSASADTPGSIDVVFADPDSDGAAGDDAKGVDGTNSIPAVSDGQYNGIYVMWAGGTPGNGDPALGYKVSAAQLTVTKTSAVYSDPINGTTNPKAIPGAIVTYTVTVANAAGGATATSVSIADSLAAEIGAGRLAFNPDFAGNAPACAAGEGITVDGVCKTNADAGDDNVDFGVTTANTVTVTGLSVPATETRTIKFQVTIP